MSDSLSLTKSRMVLASKSFFSPRKSSLVMLMLCIVYRLPLNNTFIWCSILLQHNGCMLIVGCGCQWQQHCFSIEKLEAVKYHTARAARRIPVCCVSTINILAAAAEKTTLFLSDAISRQESSISHGKLKCQGLSTLDPSRVMRRDCQNNPSQS